MYYEKQLFKILEQIGKFRHLNIYLFIGPHKSNVANASVLYPVPVTRKKLLSRIGPQRGIWHIQSTCQVLALPHGGNVSNANVA